jgi:plasmid stabilization system protein ParE
MRYKLKTTDQFWADFQESADYIAHTLENPIAAERLLDELVKNAKTLTEFPKASKPYFSPPEVSETYYALPVKNYFAFYVVRDGVVEFRRFLYSRSDLSERLK